jgi:hypothetical protein
LNEKMARLGIDRRQLTLSLRAREANAAEAAPAAEHHAEHHNGATDAGSDPHSESAAVSRHRSHDGRSPAQ